MLVRPMKTHKKWTHRPKTKSPKTMRNLIFGAKAFVDVRPARSSSDTTFKSLQPAAVTMCPPEPGLAFPLMMRYDKGEEPSSSMKFEIFVAPVNTYSKMCLLSPTLAYWCERPLPSHKWSPVSVSEQGISNCSRRLEGKPVAHIRGTISRMNSRRSDGLFDCIERRYNQIFRLPYRKSSSTTSSDGQVAKPNLIFPR